MSQTLLQEASDPQTPPERLAALSTQKELAEAVARNPNTPIDALLSLAATYPQAFVNNPATELLLLEQPELLRRLPAKVAREMIASIPLPESWYAIFASSPNDSVQQAVAERQELSEHLFFVLASSKSEPVRLLICSRADCPPQALERCAETNVERILSQVAKHPNAPAALLGTLLESAHASTRKIAAVHPNAPQEIIRLLRRAGANQSLEGYETPTESTTPEEVEALSQRGAFAKRLAAGHSSASPALQKRLFRSTDPEVRARLAGSSVVALELLEALAKDTAPYVRAEVAKSLRTPRHTLLSFDCQKEDKLVKHALVSNPNLPRESFFLLIENPPSITQAFVGKLKKNPSVPQEILQRFAFTSNYQLRLIAEENPSTSKALLELFQRAGSHRLMRYAAELRQTLTQEETQFLLQGYWGKYLLLQNPELPTEVLLQIMELPEYDNRFEKSLVNGHTVPSSLMELVGEHPNANAEVLTLLWKNHRQKSGVDRALAKNAKTPAAILDGLIKTGAVYVGKELIQNPSLTKEQKQNLFVAIGSPVREALLHAPDVDPMLLCIALSADDIALRHISSNHAKTPREFLSLLRRVGADKDFQWFQAPDESITESELISLAEAPCIGSYIHELIVRHPSCSEDLLKELALISPSKRATPLSFSTLHTLASRPDLPPSLHKLFDGDRLLEETLQLFQRKIPLPAAPLLSEISPVKLPTLQESQREYAIARVCIKLGQHVKVDDVLFEIDSDKLTMEFPSPMDGLVCSVLARTGDTILVGSHLLTLAKESANPAPAPPLLIQQRQNVVAAWLAMRHQQRISTPFFLHCPALDTPRFTALTLHEAFSPTYSTGPVWTDGREVLSGEGAAEQLFAREDLWQEPKRLSAQAVARLVAATQPSVFGAPIFTPKGEPLHPPVLVREPQGVRWVFWSRRGDAQICWCLWREDGMMRHRALSIIEPIQT
jgi:hypothetical protein